MRVLFAHGFEGSPEGSKPTYMRDALGWDVTAPIMSELGWSIASQTEVLVSHLDEGKFDLVVGSSMGGLAAANASYLRPRAETRLLLIAPAFGLAENWEGMEETGRSAWKATGERRYTGFELDIVLPWEFMESAEKMSWPIPSHPTAIMHGKFDEVVPISFSRKVAKNCENVILHEIDDSHRMKNSMRFIQEIVSNLMHGTEISSFEIGEIEDGGPSEVKEKLEELQLASSEVDDAEEKDDVSSSDNTGEQSDSIRDAEKKSDEAEKDIEEIQAEMKRLEAEMAQKKEVLETTKEEIKTEKEAQEKEQEKVEKEQKSAEVEEALKKAKEEVIEAKAEAEVARKRAEVEESEAEEARLLAEIEEVEAEEARAEADAAEKRVEEAVMKAEHAGKDIDHLSEELEKDKREEMILHRVADRQDQIDWAQIGIAEDNERDDLTKVKGIDEFTEKKLNALGILTYMQISNFDSKTTEIVNDSLEFVPGRVEELSWPQQATTIIRLEGVDSGSERPVLISEESEMEGSKVTKINWAQIGEAGDRKSDNLTKIKGVDVKIEKKLRVLGIRTFDQISKMDKDTEEAVNEALGLMPGRVSKMLWAQQALSLSDS